MKVTGYRLQVTGYRLNLGFSATRSRSTLAFRPRDRVQPALRQSLNE
ncbi:MAG: hypothetical protein F6J98_11310 [Moorea sp. SIO4G2]|nr:hypothetical protein [Moorena sp. SIO4G2]